MRICLIVITLFAFSSYGAFGQKKARISGTVSDTDGKPVDIAIVSVRGSINGAITNEKGYYSVAVTAGDSCTLIFSCIGFNKTQRVIPSVDGDMILNVEMRSLSIDLGEVTIKANQIRTNTLEKLDPRKGKLMADASGGNIESLIVTFGSGVTSTNELSSQYSVRGGSFDENIVYINGIEVYRPLLIRSGQQEGLSVINPDLTESVGFSSGGYESRYGDKMSSVLDITYKTPENFEGAVSASLLGGNVYIGSKSGKFSQVTGFRYKRGTTLLNTLDTKGTYDPTFIDLQTNMTYRLAPKLDLGFLGNVSKNTYNFYPKEEEKSFGTIDNAKTMQVYYAGSEKDQFQTLFGALTLSYSLSEATSLNLQASAFQSKESETYDILSEYWLSDAAGADADESEKTVVGIGANQIHARNRLHSDVFNLSHAGSHRLGSNLIQWGVNYQRENVKDRMQEWEKRDSMGYSLPYDGKEVNLYYTLFSETQIGSNRMSGYLQDTYKYRISQGLFTMTAGVRGSYWDFNDEFIFSPRASVGFIPSANQNFTFRFATGLYYQAPFYKEFRKIVTNEERISTVELNKDIKSQQSIHFIMGGDYGFYLMDRPFKFTAELYYKLINDLVPYSVNNVKVTYAGENISNGFAAGLDMKLFGEFVPGIDSWLNFSVMRARQKVNGVMVPMPTDQPFNISLFFNDYFPNNDRLTMNLRAIWSDGLPFSSPGHNFENSFRGKDYRRIDIGMAYLLLGEKDPAYRHKGFLKYLRNVWVGVDVFNLLDIPNINSYTWVSDNTSGFQYAVPNYLTSRQLNVKLLVEF